jgi:hypothetical protein
MIALPKIKWREYLNGEYIINDENQRNKIRNDIRERAKTMMCDLLLIAERSDSRQKTLIFKKPQTRDRLIRPLITALWNNSAFLGPEQEEYENIVKLMQDLELTSVKYDFEKLFDTTLEEHEAYCKNKRQQVDEKLKEIGERKWIETRALPS